MVVRENWSGCSGVFGTTVDSDEEFYSGLVGFECCQLHVTTLLADNPS